MPTSPGPAAADPSTPTTAHAARRVAPPAAWSIDAFVASLSGRSELTQAAYREDVAQFTTWAAGAGATDPAAVDHRLLRRWLAALAARGYARSSISRKASSLRAYFRWAERRGLLGPDGNPATALRSPSGPSRLPRVPRPAETVGALDRLAAAAVAGDPDAVVDHAVVELLYGAGLRVSELCTLRPGDVDLPAATVTVLGKRARVRRVPVPPVVVTTLRDYVSRGRPARCLPASPDDALFLNRRGRRMSPRDVRRIVERVPMLRDQDADGRRLHPHSLRHAYATHLLEGGRGPPNRARTPRSRRRGDDADLHPRDDRSGAGRLRRHAPASLIQPPQDDITESAMDDDAGIERLWAEYKQSGVRDRA